MDWKQKAGEWVDWLDEHSKGLKTITGLALVAYGYSRGNEQLVNVGLYLSGLGTGDKLRKFSQTKSWQRTLEAPAVRKLSQRIPFRK